MEYFTVTVPYHYLFELPLDEAVVYYFIETLIINQSAVSNDTTIQREMLEDVIYEGFIFIDNEVEILGVLIKKGYLCSLETSNGEHITLGSASLHL